MPRLASLRSGEIRLMAALSLMGMVQPSGAAEAKRMASIVAKGLAERAQGAANLFRLTPEGSAWIARYKGLDSAASVSDPIEEGRRLLDRGLGLADSQAA